MKILVLTRDEDCSLDDIVKAIQSDPALTGRIIKLATSVQLGNVSGTITSPREAAIRLGLRTVSNVALGFTLISGNRTGRCTAFDYDHYWAWSLANAIAAQVICADPGRAVPSAEAFTCGLLARIGQLALASVHPNEYAAVLSRAESDPTAALANLEQDAFHIDHDQVTAAMMSDWGLPPVFSEAVLLVAGAASEGEGEGPDVRHLGQILEAAAVLADICLESESAQHLHWQKLQETRARLGLSAADFQVLFQSIVKEWEDWSRFLRLPTNRVLSIPEIQRRARSQAKDTEAATVPDAAESGLRILAVDDDPPPCDSSCSI
jgi:HD-like signal output (HDOD) protein